MHPKHPQSAESSSTESPNFAVWGVMVLCALLFGAGVTIGMQLASKRAVSESPPVAAVGQQQNAGEAIALEMTMLTKHAGEWARANLKVPETLADAMSELEHMSRKLNLACETEPDGAQWFVLAEPLLSDEMRQQWWSKLPPAERPESDRSISAIRFTILGGETWISRVALSTGLDRATWQEIPNAALSSRESLDLVREMVKQCEEELRLRKPPPTQAAHRVRPDDESFLSISAERLR